VAQGAGARGCGYALPVGSGDALGTADGADGTAIGTGDGAADEIAVATTVGTAEGCAEVGDGLAVTQALPPPVGTGTGVAEPRYPPLGLALTLGTGDGQDTLVEEGLATGTAVPLIPVGLADAEGLSVAEACWDAFLLA
jgi:hypothetical protein